ncbi:putative pyridoxal-dependent aspartate 1-decarboxylase [Allohahella marinimesophila]|uniref:Pyridoxal-dependent aspartate 1-decarboxylase n=2 Tax=Allohahella marinimesophila TaxID=1054972 RepID=A0ABP7PUJ9_9GAMM
MPKQDFIEMATEKTASASIESMYRVFTVAEAPESTLGRIDQQISHNLAGFLQDHIVAVEKDLDEVEKDFSSSEIPEQPIFVSEQTQHLLDKLVAHSVHTASPSFIGHMTSALPYFMLPLSRIMIALNQNLVKTETSKAFTPLERQVLGMLHRLVYGASDAFYERNLHDHSIALGSMCSGGTIANLTALWVARNQCFPADGDFKGVRKAGLARALKHYGYDDCAVLVSKRGHYSLSKSADLLGLGSDQVIAIDTDDSNRIRPDRLIGRCEEMKAAGTRVIAIVGVAGTTETGNVDNLAEVAAIAKRFGIHFHVDAAWGGPTLFSSTHKHLLKGIELADSVTLDAHKQLYVPMGSGLVLFRDPLTPNAIEHHAQYIIRKGSRDLGSKTLEGSRPGMAMLIQSALKIIGRTGYEILIDQGIEKARYFAAEIKKTSEFELISEPELNLLTYRFAPESIRRQMRNCTPQQCREINELLSKITKRIQKTQRNRGKAFVSRTRLNPPQYDYQDCIVFRVVLANPLTTRDILRGVLEEQSGIAAEPEVRELVEQIEVIIRKAA